MNFVQCTIYKFWFYTYLRYSFMWLDENASNIANVYIEAQKRNCVCFASLIIRVVSLILRSRMKQKPIMFWYWLFAEKQSITQFESSIEDKLIFYVLTFFLSGMTHLGYWFLSGIWLFNMYKSFYQLGWNFGWKIKVIEIFTNWLYIRNFKQYILTE